MEVMKTTKLTKYYGKVRGIKELDLTVTHGEFFGFIGPNGAGKSTTIRTVLGLIAPTSGDAMIFGKDVTKEREAILQNIGYLPSEALFYQGMKVKAGYAVISNEYEGNRTLFIGNGTQLIASGISIQTSEAANVLLEKKQEKWYILTSAPCKIVIDGKAVQSGITTELTLLAVQ